MPKELYEDIFEEIYKKNLSKIQHYAQCYLSDPELAKDIAQEVFMTLFKNKKVFENGDDPIPFLIKITKNKCLNLLRHNTIRHKFISSANTELKNSLNYYALKDDTSELIYAKEATKLLNRAFDDMSDKAKRCFEMSRFEGKRYEEIANFENVSVKTVEYRVLKAVKILKEHFRHYKR